MNHPKVLDNPGSRSVKPDLDWSQVQETISMLCLAMAQIEATLTDSSKSVNTLTHCFVQMAEESQALVSLSQQLEDSEANRPIKQELSRRAASISARIGEAAVAFQFHDRLSQKLSHVNESLTHLGELMHDRSRLFNPDEWLRLQQEIKANYTMDCERLMFDLIMSGTPLPEALERYHREHDRMQAKGSLGDEGFELF